MAYNAFYPGQVWLDTDGNPIHAHGGSILHENGTYYFYGENKDRTDGKSDLWHYGVRAYASKDLYNWESLGIIIPPVLDDPTSPLHPNTKMDRPHIVHNPKTGKYVCWLKIQEPNGDQTETVLTADRFTGPYTIVRTGLHPCGLNAGDFDLVVDEETGKCYYFFEKVHTGTICAELTDDYTDVTGEYTSHFPHPYPPFTREATAHFLRGGKHYLVTSGTTGYLPNPSEVAVADDYHGPYRVLGDPHVNDASRTSFRSQISSVFKVPGKKDLYIACADRWTTWLDTERLPYKMYAAMFESAFSGHPERIDEIAREYGITEEEKQLVMGGIPMDTSTSTYVWLPLRFDGENVYIDWMDEWKLEDYE